MRNKTGQTRKIPIRTVTAYRTASSTSARSFEFLLRVRTQRCDCRGFNEADSANASITPYYRWYTFDQYLNGSWGLNQSAYGLARCRSPRRYKAGSPTNLYGADHPMFGMSRTCIQVQANREVRQLALQHTQHNQYGRARERSM